MKAKVLQIARKVVLGVVCVFAVITLALAADFTSRSAADFAQLAIAVSALTLVALPIMIVVDHFRPDAFTSLVVVEIASLSVLWVLWLATGATTGHFCSHVGPSQCGEPGVIAAFSFLNWLTLLGYTGTLAILAFRAELRGRSPWTSSVEKGDFLA